MTDATRGPRAAPSPPSLPPRHPDRRRQAALDPRATAEAVLFEIRRVIVGQDQMLERVLVALLAGGHLLLEGVPGLAKTLTIRTLADALDASFRRIQFTPDLVPGDLVGTRIYRPDSRHLRHRARPGLLQLPPRRRDQPRPGQGPVRAARGDAGAPGHDRAGEPRGPAPVPRDGDPEPHRVRGHLPAARGAGGPLPHEGRRRLPDPGRGGDGRRALAPPAAEVRPVLDRRRASPGSRPRRPGIYVDPAIVAYAVAIVGATREPARFGLASLAPYIGFGASPRGSISLIHAARALALIRGRRYVVPQDVADLARDVLRHRIVPELHRPRRGGHAGPHARRDHPGRPGAAAGDRGGALGVIARPPARAARPAPAPVRRPRRCCAPSTSRSAAGSAAWSPASSAPTSWVAAPSSPRSGPTSPATTSAGSTGTSRPACWCRTSASTSRSARSRRGSSSTSRRRWPSAPPTAARPTSPRASRSRSATCPPSAATGSAS